MFSAVDATILKAPFRTAELGRRLPFRPIGDAIMQGRQSLAVLLCLGLSAALSTSQERPVATFQVPKTEAMPYAEGVVSLYALDHLLYSFAFPTQEPGAIVRDGVVYNSGAQLDYGRCEPGKLTLGVSGGELACVKDLGDLRHPETGMSRFGGIDCDGADLR